MEEKERNRFQMRKDASLDGRGNPKERKESRDALKEKKKEREEEKQRDRYHRTTKGNVETVRREERKRRAGDFFSGFDKHK